MLIRILIILYCSMLLSCAGFINGFFSGYTHSSTIDFFRGRIVLINPNISGKYSGYARLLTEMEYDYTIEDIVDEYGYPSYIQVIDNKNVKLYYYDYLLVIHFKREGLNPDSYVYDTIDFNKAPGGMIRQYSLGHPLKKRNDGEIEILNVNRDETELKSGDIIISINDIEISDRYNAIQLINKIGIDSINLKIKRNGKSLTIENYNLLIEDYYEYYFVIRDLLYKNKMVNIAVIINAVNTSPYLSEKIKTEWVRAEKDFLLSDIENYLLFKLSYEPKFNIVDRSRIEFLLSEIGLSQAGIVKQNDALEAGKMLGANYILFIDFSRFQPDKYTIQDTFSARLIHVESGKVLSSSIELN